MSMSTNPAWIVPAQAPATKAGVLHFTSKPFHQQTWSNSDGELMEHSAHTFGTSIPYYLFPIPCLVHFFTSSLFHSSLFTAHVFQITFDPKSPPLMGCNRLIPEGLTVFFATQLSLRRSNPWKEVQYET